MCCLTYKAVLKAAPQKTERDAQEKTSWRTLRFLLFALRCSSYEPREVKKAPQPCLVEATLTTWTDECADQMVCPTLSETRDEAEGMADKSTSVQKPAPPCKFGKTWSKLFKCCNSAVVSELA